jgi:geranylgeranyl diphosphate synthase type I
MTTVLPALSPHPSEPSYPSEPSAASAATALDTTRRARELTEPMLRARVDRLEPWIARICSYHLGWCRVDGTPTRGDLGKAVRPAFAVLAAEAVLGQAASAAPGAAAVELIHNFSLIHDDIMDGDERRRQQPTAWREFGVGPAILAGDALQVLAFEVLLDDGGPLGPASASRLATALRRLLEGQARDLQFATRPWTGPGAVTIAEYQEMALGKTGSLLGAASAIGALLGGGTPTQVQVLGDAAEQLGLAFQCVDDLLGIWGDPVRTGKPVHGDLRERKRSLPVLAALEASPAVARRLTALLGGTRGDRMPNTPVGTVADEQRLVEAAELIESAGGRQACVDQAATALAKAQDLLALVPMPQQVRSQYAALADACVARSK